MQFTVYTTAGFDDSSVRYSNGSFTVNVSGYYFVHLTITIEVKDRNETASFYGCIQIDGIQSKCRYKKEQAGWMGTLEAIESRLYLKEGQILKVTFNDKTIIYSRNYDTTFNMRLLY